MQYLLPAFISYAFGFSIRAIICMAPDQHKKVVAWILIPLGLLTAFSIVGFLSHSFDLGIAP